MPQKARPGAPQGRRPPPPRARKRAPAGRREAILKAALQVFAAKGFAATRLDDVAAKARIAKGTVYLYFEDKEALFEQLILGFAAPVLEQVRVAAVDSDLPFKVLLERVFALFRTEVLGTERKLVLRLIFTEGPRFPSIAEFYYREVVSRALGMLRNAAQRSVARGELADDTLAHFPQLVAAPLLMSVLWDALFSRFEPLDVEGLLAAHAEMLTNARRTAK
jgi:AcrR family transcriptional regulator